MKQYFKFWFIFSITLLLLSCEKDRKDEILNLLNSNDKTKIIKGCSLINSEKDTMYVNFLLRNIDDSRVSNHSDYYGISVYEAKIKALKRISNLDPPNKITYNVDSLNISFYTKWAVNKGYIK